MESSLTLVVLFAAISKTITERFYKPIRTVVEKSWPESIGAYIADQAVPYVAWAISGIMVWVSGVNLFEGVMPETAGVVFTALASGLGANLISDAFDWPKTLARELTVYSSLRPQEDEEDPRCDIV